MLIDDGLEQVQSDLYVIAASLYSTRSMPGNQCSDFSNDWDGQRSVVGLTKTLVYLAQRNEPSRQSAVQLQSSLASECILYPLQTVEDFLRYSM